MSREPEALRLADALDAEFVQGRISNSTGRESAVELRRLALKVEQEPVAWRYKYPDGVWRFSNGERVNGSDSIKSQALYAAPPKREWVGLTDDEVSEIIDREIGFNSCWGPEEAFARAVEQALKEKNHG